MITYQSRYLVRGEVWFDNEPGAEPVDWILYRQRPSPAPRSRWREFYTRILDLRLTPEALLAQMEKFVAADIRKAQRKDQTRCERLETRGPGVLAEFADFYDRFVARKGLEALDRKWLARTAQAGALDFWVAKSPGGEPLVRNVLYRDRNRVRGMHLASFHQQATERDVRVRLARASRLLTWQTMLFYKQQGIGLYDLGGWYTGTTDQARLGINEFKKGYGGQAVCEYECEQIRSLKGWVVLTLARLWQDFHRPAPCPGGESKQGLGIENGFYSANPS